jgi:hypothetical protein
MDIDKNYKLEKDKYGWIISKATERVHQKTGEAYTHLEPSYYARLSQCLQKYVEVTLGDSEDLKELSERVDAIPKIIEDILKENNLV